MKPLILGASTLKYGVDCASHGSLDALRHHYRSLVISFCFFFLSLFSLIFLLPSPSFFMEKKKKLSPRSSNHMKCVIVFSSPLSAHRPLLITHCRSPTTNFFFLPSFFLHLPFNFSFPSSSSFSHKKKIKIKSRRLMD